MPTHSSPGALFLFPTLDASCSLYSPPPDTWTLLLPMATPSRALSWETLLLRGVPEFPELMPRGLSHPLHPSLPVLGGTTCSKRLLSLPQLSPSSPRGVVTHDPAHSSLIPGRALAGKRSPIPHTFLCTSLWGGLGKLVSDLSPTSPKLFLKYHYPKQESDVCVFIDINAVGFQVSQKFRMGLRYIF